MVRGGNALKIRLRLFLEDITGVALRGKYTARDATCVAASRGVITSKCVVPTLRIHHILLTFQRPRNRTSSVFQEWHYDKNLDNLHKRDR